ncbi:MAG: U32 family peptidase [Butyrivibrio sp.]|nr:U32 family peptidase [Butyrivibrio sp.]
MKKVELLSPAGGYETMVGAFNAGADAVYLGGSKFGARAYADNFDQQQLLDAIVYAHLHRKKIYMTVNTLIKEKEFSEVYDFMLPFAEKKLDGVIVQDLGVARLIRDEFPGIELHASTQMTVTGVYGAGLLKERGFCRVVPARELSLMEMSAIRREADIEVEAFIHGAMCYCYSGACLFSSVVGGRSGNRGRCAQPCRLAYRAGKGAPDQYILSLRDMNTLSIIPELIRGGIDSFKIEGRMKKAEYSAGVTALYRKYIDRFYADPNAEYSVSKEDMEILKSLYQRTDISEGYYHRHNDRTMVTISSPAYNPTSEKVLSDVRQKYLTSKLKEKCDVYCSLTAGERAKLTMTVTIDGDVFYAEEYGGVVQEASKRPMDEDAVKKQLGKLGDTAYEAEKIDIEIDDKGSGKGIFIAVSELNDLRRRLVSRMDSSVLGEGSEETVGKKVVSEEKSDTYYKEQIGWKEDAGRHGKAVPLHVLATTVAQFEAVLNKAGEGTAIKRVYLDSDAFLSLLKSEKGKETFDRVKGSGAEFFVALPYVTREEIKGGPEKALRAAESVKEDVTSGADEIREIKDNLEGTGFCGVLVRNLEQLGILKNIGRACRTALDYGIYTWNSEALFELLDMSEPGKSFLIDSVNIPYELSLQEAAKMAGAVKEKVRIPLTYNVYGHLPMMISAGCIKKTTDRCSGKTGQIHTEQLQITDRMNNNLPVTINCRECYNIIWNAHATSLHKRFDKVERLFEDGVFDSVRADFTIEDRILCEAILDYYVRRAYREPSDASGIFKDKEYTTAYFKRGVE